MLSNFFCTANGRVLVYTIHCHCTYHLSVLRLLSNHLASWPAGAIVTNCHTIEPPTCLSELACPK